MTDIQYMTQDKIDALKNELDDLQRNKLPALVKRIDDARQMGDLSENAEYHMAREDMAWAQSRVLEIKAILDDAEVISSESNTNKVTIGSSIVVKVDGKEKTYTIVGAQEADPLNGKISNESPLGNAFLNKKEGEKIKIKLPKGEVEYKIIEIK